jgi:hypothetical protein
MKSLTPIVLVVFASTLFTLHLYSQEIINQYSPVLNIQQGCSSVLTIGDTNMFFAGDKVLIIQMQGALFYESDNPDYGKLRNRVDAGNYEFARIASVNANTIVLEHNLLRNYSVDGNVQLVFVPEFTNYRVRTPITCPAWNGRTGGVIVMEVKNKLEILAAINADEMGFRGGNAVASQILPQYYIENYVIENDPGKAALKGEGIGRQGISGLNSGKGAVLNGGGGGNNHNGGGGGGANAGIGGQGGYGWYDFAAYSGDFKQAAGLGAYALQGDSVLFAGGGGGAGHTNQSDEGSGGAGGGIIIIVADEINASGSAKISANGGNGGSVYADGGGGGGAGGTIVISANKINSKLIINSNGGNGGNTTVNFTPLHAPGGGGGGGKIFLSNNISQNNVTLSVKGGNSGYCQADRSDKYGSTDGKEGIISNSIYLPESNQAGGNRSAGLPNLYYKVSDISKDMLTADLDERPDLCSGDKVLIIQMQGAMVNTQADPSFGAINIMNNAGNFEINIVAAVVDKKVILNRPLLRSYDKNGSVQLIRIATFNSYTVANPLSCTPWNGSIGGVLAMTVQDTLFLKAPINVNGKGFRGGKAVNSENTPQGHTDIWAGSPDSSLYGLKGEGIAIAYEQRQKAGKGALATAGGGGNNHNGGGGGGANAGCGGGGGWGWDKMPGDNTVATGKGGNAAQYKENILLAGGGGAGHANDLSLSSGGAGGGIIIISARHIISENQNISALGDMAIDAPFDGAGGGGGGGSILLSFGKLTGNLLLEAAGGNGGNVKVHTDGPGGGGGGGYIGLNQTIIPQGLTTNVSAGYSGVQAVFNRYGTTEGCRGIVKTAVDIPGGPSILTSIAEDKGERGKTGLQIFPNPGNTNIELSFSESVYEIRLYTMQGIQYGVSLFPADDQLHINAGLEHIPAGVYTVLALLKNGGTIAEKLIISR